MSTQQTQSMEQNRIKRAFSLSVETYSIHPGAYISSPSTFVVTCAKDQSYDRFGGRNKLLDIVRAGLCAIPSNAIAADRDKGVEQRVFLIRVKLAGMVRAAASSNRIIFPFSM